MKYDRICPVCGSKIVYESEKGYKRAVRKNSPCRKCSGVKRRFNNIKRLCNEEIIDCYYIGFILADGHIEKNIRLQISLSLKDKEWLESFKEYVGAVGAIRIFPVGKNYECGISVQDKESIPILCKNFDIKSNKTKNPPDIKAIDRLTDNQLLALLIGFIDGDGSIRRVYKRKDCNIKIKNHSAWLNILTLFDERINKKNRAKINNSGYAEVSFTENKEIRRLKVFAMENNLPVLKRKWDLIDKNRYSKYEISNERLNEIRILAQQGKSVNEISKETGLKYMTVYTKLIKNNIQFKHEKNRK